MKKIILMMLISCGLTTSVTALDKPIDPKLSFAAGFALMWAAKKAQEVGKEVDAWFKKIQDLVTHKVTVAAAMFWAGRSSKLTAEEEVYAQIFPGTPLSEKIATAISVLNDCASAIPTPTFSIPHFEAVSFAGGVIAGHYYFFKKCR